MNMICHPFLYLHVEEVTDKVGSSSNVEEPNHHLVEYGVGAHMLPKNTGCCTSERGIKKQGSSGCDNNSTTQGNLFHLLWW